MGLALEMSPKVASRQDTRTALLQAGMDIMITKGYSNTGIQEVLNTLGVPKGSFYHYFESKEHFAVCIIRQFDQDHTGNLLRILRNPSQSPLQRLRTFCDTKRELILSQDCRHGCLIGNLSQEMADQSEVLRQELSIVMNKWIDVVAACMEEGQKLGELEPHCCPRDLSEAFHCGWNGALTRAKTIKSGEPMDSFIRVWFEHILPARKV